MNLLDSITEAINGITQSSLISGLVGGLLGSMITAFVSLRIMRLQFQQEEKTIRENRSSEIMKQIEGSIWTILNGYIYEFSLNEKFKMEFYKLPALDDGAARADLFNRISEEKMKMMSRIHEAERDLIQQRAMIELFIGKQGVIAFDVIEKKLPQLKDAIGKIKLEGREIKTIRPEDAENWKEYSESLSELRKVLWNYAK